MEALMNGFAAVFAGECVQEEVESMKKLLRIQEDEILEIVTRERKTQAKYDQLVSQRQSDVLEQNALWKAAKEADEHVENLEAELKDVQLSKEKLLDELFAERRFWWNEREHYKEKLEMKELELAAALEREEVRREEYETVAGENNSQLPRDDVQTVVEMAVEVKRQFESLEKELEEKTFQLIDAQKDFQVLEEELDDYKNYWQERGAELEQENVNLHAKVQFLADSVRSYQQESVKNVKELAEAKELAEKYHSEMTSKIYLVKFLEQRLDDMAMTKGKEADSIPICEENAHEDIISGPLFDNVDFSGFTTFFH